LPSLQHPLGNQHVGQERLEICALPSLLSSGINHMEHGLLPSSYERFVEIAARSEAISVRRLPLQFRELSPPPP